MLPLLLLTAQTFSRHYTFRYAGVPYDLGLRHIHSPEHVQSTHRLGVPLFKIHSASTPLQLTNGTAFVRFRAWPSGSARSDSSVLAPWPPFHPTTSLLTTTTPSHTHLEKESLK